MSNDYVPSDFDCTRLRDYLIDGFTQILPCVNATRQWTYHYDGKFPSIKEAVHMLYNPCEPEEPCESITTQSCPESDQQETKIDKGLASPSQYPLVDPADIYMYCIEQLNSCLSEMKSNSSPGQSSGYYSINCNLQPGELLKEEASFFSKEVQDDLEFWSLMRDDDFDCTPVPVPVRIS